MKVTYSWLKDYVDIKLKPEELAHKLTMAGLEVTSLEKIGTDHLLHIEVTTNRPDWLSVIGIAREVAAITSKKLHLPNIKALNPKLEMPTVKVIDQKGCLRYTARLIEDIKVKPSPKWLSDKLKSVGSRPINNIVDITNFCLLEYGQPLHAFDFDKLKSGVVVRKAKANEEIITIDEVKRKLDPSMLVIADETRPVALAGIMGGADTEVSQGTKRVLLESAYFDPATIRRTSKKLGLTSESSYRFERRVDLEIITTASNRAVSLMQELAGPGEISKIKDVGKKKFTSRNVSLKPTCLNQILGVTVPTSRVKSILTSLGLKPKASNSFEIPSWRGDLTREIDLIEEVVRIWGYEKIPTSTVTVKPQAGLEASSMKTVKEVSNLLISAGLNEAITYSLTSSRLAALFGKEEKDLVRVENPLSPELAFMRGSLLPGLISAVGFNINRKNLDVKLFEVGPVYFSSMRGKCEKQLLAVSLTGARSNNWQDDKSSVDIFYLKGILEELLDRLGIEGVKFEACSNSIFEPAQSMVVKIKGNNIGFLGRLNASIRDRVDIDYDVFCAELNLSSILKVSKKKKIFNSIPKFPPVLRDISLLVKKDVLSKEITSLITETGGDLIEEVRLFDEYKGKQISKGCKGLSYSIKYQASNRTLTSEEIDSLHNKICEGLTSTLGAQVRST